MNNGTWQYSAVRDPLTGRLLGMATTTTPDKGEPVSLYTLDEDGFMTDYETEDEALNAILSVMRALSNIKFNRSSQPKESKPGSLANKIERIYELRKPREENGED